MYFLFIHWSAPKLHSTHSTPSSTAQLFAWEILIIVEDNNFAIHPNQSQALTSHIYYYRMYFIYSIFESFSHNQFMPCQNCSIELNFGFCLMQNHRYKSLRLDLDNYSLEIILPVACCNIILYLYVHVPTYMKHWKLAASASKSCQRVTNQFVLCIAEFSKSC